MSTKLATTLILLATAITASPSISVDVTKSKALFIFKWIDFTPSLVGHEGAEKTSLKSLSKFYVFADYFGKVQRKELGVKINYSINGSSTYQGAPMTVTVTGDKVAIDAFSIAQCEADDKFTAVFKGVALEDKDFVLTYDITCTQIKEMEMIRSIVRSLSAKFKEAAKNGQEAINETSKAIHNKIDEVETKGEAVQESIKELSAKIVEDEANLEEQIEVAAHSQKDFPSRHEINVPPTESQEDGFHKESERLIL